ncbi:MAG: hypothetical protein MI923_18525 [Phycisphaerales bacterium]|nr:hypothetical protein [Phycisphaerales bacterium]
MASKEPTILTRNITPGAAGTRVSREKYELVRKAILAVVPTSKKGVLFKELPKAVAERLPADLFPKKGSVSWYATTVKLDLEARGFIERVPGVAPQRLRRLK